MDEVIVEKVDLISNGNSSEGMSNVEENNGRSIIKNLSTTEKEDAKDDVPETMKDCEAILIDNDPVIEETCDGNHITNKQQEESHEDLNINQNLPVINENCSEQNANKDSLITDSKRDDDICIVREGNAVLPLKPTDKPSSLSTIAMEYGNSDSETEDSTDLGKGENNEIIVLKEVQMQPYRSNIEASSSEESDSDDDTTSSSDSSIVAESNDSDSDNSRAKKGKGNNANARKNNEMKSELDDLPPIEDLKISVPEVLCDPLGEVAWMVEPLVVVRPKPGKPTLNLDTVLFVEKGQRALGKIFDVFGQVNEPHYCVRFNSSQHIQECDIKVGMIVYYCPNTEYTSLVFLHELQKMKGIDANADEPPEFSDDEEERLYYEKLKAKQATNSKETDIPFKRKRASSPTTGWQSNHPWNRNMQRQRRGHSSRGNHRQYPSAQSGNQLQNLWHAYSNNWPAMPGALHPEAGEQYGYGAYPNAMQSMHYGSPNINAINQNYYSSDNYYNENGVAVPLNPRIPYNTCPRLPPGHIPFQNRPNSSQNMRYRNANTFGQPQMPQTHARMNVPWVSLPPPPPPPPPSSGTG